MIATARIALLVASGLGALVAARNLPVSWRPDGDDIAGARIRAVSPAPRPASAAASAAAGAASAATLTALAMPRPRNLPQPEGDAFGTVSWLPPPPKPAPPPPAPPPPPPPPPTAPPLPFVFVGMAERGADRPQAYLAKGNALLVVSVGDLIEGGVYRVDSLSSAGVTLTYLPLNKQQTVNVP